MASEHRSYTDRELEVFRETSLTEILREFGKNTQHTRGGLYYSPFHDEKTPSFHIDEEKHLWCDHGICAPGQKSGGDVIDLVRALKGCTFSEACAFLAEFHPNLSITHNDEIIDLPGQSTTGPAVRVIDTVQDKFTSQFCLDYAEGERHIPRNILMVIKK